MKRSLLHIAGLVFNQPHAITPAKLDVIRGVLAAKLNRGPSAMWDYEDDDEDDPESPDRNFPITPDGIATISVQGTLVRRASGLDAYSGLRSYADISDDIEEAAEDQAIVGIILDVDSPGGQCSGCFDLTDQIAAITNKPVYAVASDSMFSAAYALGSAADLIYVSRTSGVGSIGVIAGHCDMSKADQMDGYKYTLITYGKYKAEGNPHEPLSDHALASIQDEVNRLGDMFVATVARNRGVEPAAIKAMQAECYFGENGITAGLADKMGGIEDALADMRTALGLPQIPEEAPDEDAADVADAFGMSKRATLEAEGLAVRAMFGDLDTATALVVVRRAAKKTTGDINAFAVRCLAPAMLAGESGQQHITGCPVPYGILSHDLGGFKEVYEPGCFSESIQQDDIYALFNHHEDHVLGRKSAGTLAVTEDSTGVHFDITPPSKDWAEALVESMQRGDIDGMSAAFYISKYRWEMRDGWRVRVISAARMVESSVATFPYFKTSAAVTTPAATQVLSQMRQKLNRARLESAKSN